MFLIFVVNTVYHNLFTINGAIAGKEALNGSRGSRADKTSKAKIEEFEKVIGRQTIVIETLKKNLKLI